jgi:hypothetical protein
LAWLWDDFDPVVRGLLVAVLAFVAVTFLFRSRPTQTTSASKPEPDVVDLVLSDETRRPWSPTLARWSPPSAETVLLVPAADYHLAEIVPLAAELGRRDIPTRIAIGVSPWSRTWQALSSYPDLEVHSLPEAETFEGRLAAVVVMKDTGSLGPFVERCHQLGIPAIGKVEGAQDFWDADTPEQRRPYRNLDLVLCQGDFDAEALDRQATEVVGSTRLERLWWAPPATPREPLAVINLNFVYGVGPKDRRLWLESAVAGCERAGLPYVISTHPAEKARPDRMQTTISASRLLPHASVLVSRFSTVPLEAMARGVPFVYHNPHGEQAGTFADPMGAFEVSRSADELAQALGSLDIGADARSRVEGFFAHHVSVDPARSSEQRSVEALLGVLGEGR